MSEKKASWGKVSATPKFAKKSVVAKSASSGWTMERLAPRETKRTQTNSVSYSGMTVIFRNGKK